MPGGIVTTLAEQRRFRGQKLRMIAAVRRMACQAVLFHRGMLPQEGTALVGVTLVAKLIHIVRLDHLRPETAVLVVTRGALHESFFQRVMRLPRLLRPDIPVAGKAKDRFPCL